MTPHTHRPQMPYSFQGVNATYINAYAFPGGSIAATRGILLSLESEAELSALLGHELGHVNARHTAQQMSKGHADTGRCWGSPHLCRNQRGCLRTDGNLNSACWAPGRFLRHYSRDNEREADRLGMTYMIKSGYGTEGFVKLMAMLNSLNKGNSSCGFPSIFHPSHEPGAIRYRRLHSPINEFSAYANGKPLNRERYMDNTAALRKLKPAIELFQQAEELMAKESYDKAEDFFSAGIETRSDGLCRTCHDGQMPVCAEKI